MRDRLLAWYDENRRDLPWRRDCDPYRVWVSEIMLQQTRVEAARGHYLRFIQRFPTASDLAAASLEEVFKLWEGLGYYSRARRMREAAQIIHREGFPGDYEAILKLPGVGAYTAGAVASICFGERVLAVDGNVLRVMARVLCLQEAVSVPSARRAVEDALKALLPCDRPGDFNQALMELGAMVCTPKSPKCLVCPWRGDCRGFAEGKEGELPIRLPKKEKVREALEVMVILCGGKVLVRQRPGGGLLGGWWEFPHGENFPWKPRKEADLGEFRHVFTHRIWDMRGALYSAREEVLPGPAYRWVDADELRALPIPSAMAHWREKAWEAMA